MDNGLSMLKSTLVLSVRDDFFHSHGTDDSQQQVFASFEVFFKLFGDLKKKINNR